MILETLEELKMDCRLCRIDRGYRSGADYGIILHYSSDVVVMKKYDRDGYYDGLKMMRADDIEVVRWNGNNLRARSQFVNERGLNLDPVRVDVMSFDAFMETAQKEYGYVSVWNDREDSFNLGPIISQDESWIKMVNLGNPDRMDRTNVLLERRSITSLEVDGIYERNVYGLHNPPKEK